MDAPRPATEEPTPPPVVAAIRPLVPVKARPRRRASDHKGAGPLREREARERVDRTFWAGLVSLGVLVLVAVAGLELGVLESGRRVTLIPWELTLVILSFLVTAAMSVLAVRRYPRRESQVDEENDGGLGRALVRGRRDPRALVEFWIVATGVSLGAAFAIASFTAYMGYLTALGSRELLPGSPLLFASLSLLADFAPIGILEHRRVRHVRDLEERFPEFLRDLTEAHRASMTMARAVRVVSRGDYGALTPYARRMAQQVSWGLPFPVALRLFAERVGTPLIQRTVSLIVKATEAGGDIANVLDASARDAREIKAAERERRVTMGTYVIVVYISFGVFLSVVAVLQALFVPAMLRATQDPSVAGVPGLAVSTVHELDFKFIYFCAGFVQALGSGIVAGVLSEGTFAAGLKHASILVTLALVVLGLLL